MKPRGEGEICLYCDRTLESVHSRSPLKATRDHVVPRSKGGCETVWACRLCNELKKDMMPDDWEAFMECFPEWWLRPEFGGNGWSDKRRVEQEAQVRSSGRIPRPKLSYWETVAYLRAQAGKKAKVAPASIPIEYDDPRAQAAFEAVYRNRLSMLRIEI